jgi:phosphoribosyl 1,2-cyclic phosphodiesterase
MTIDILASSSAGNCYVISGLKEKIMIEAGILFKLIKEKMNFNFSDVACCLLTHDHGDHAKSIKHILKLGIKVYSSAGTFDALNINDHFAIKIDSSSLIETDEFRIKAFETEHDCPEPLGFIIFSKIEYKKIVFATDTYFLRYRFNKVNAYMLEVNYITEDLEKAIKDGKINEAGANRIRKSHFNLERIIQFLEKTDTKTTEMIIPIHTSSRFGNNYTIKSTIEKKFDISVIIKQNRIEL